MDSVNFGDLPLEERAYLLCYFGSYLTTLVTPLTKRYLFAFGNEYVELVYVRESGAVEYINQLRYRDLDSYLSCIHLDL
jgi:hypothetical protein